MDLLRMIRAVIRGDDHLRLEAPNRRLRAQQGFHFAPFGVGLHEVDPVKPELLDNRIQRHRWHADLMRRIRAFRVNR